MDQDEINKHILVILERNLKQQLEMCDTIGRILTQQERIMKLLEKKR